MAVVTKLNYIFLVAQSNENRKQFTKMETKVRCTQSILLTIIMKPSSYINSVDVDVQYIENSVQ